MKSCVAIVLFLICAGLLKAQDSLRFLSATTGAACQSIKYHNGYLFTGTGSTLRVYDISAGIPYAMVFEYRYRSAIMDLLINNDYLYVAANHDGMSKWDISDPVHPLKIFDIPTDIISDGTQDVSLSGDTIFLAQYSKMSAYKDYVTTFAKIADFGNTNGFGYITGADIKNGIVAYTVTSLWGAPNGVNLYNAHSFAFISFYHQPFCYPENVIWGKNNSLLHVLGGTNSTDGYFYTLDVSNLSSPQLVYGDTVLGAAFGVAIANPNNAENINDTIYISDWGGLQPNDGSNCYIRVYDATDPSHVHRIAYIPAGLWHFDLAVAPPKIYVASEWYGIKTVDISDLLNPVDEGNTLTGGWNTGSDVFGDYLLVGNEGFGFKLYSISDKTNPVLVNVNNDPGFVMKARFSADGNYIYTANSTYQGFRVYRRDSLIETGFIQEAVANERLKVYGNKVYGYLNFSGKFLKIADVSDPYHPQLDTSVAMEISDMFIDVTGKLFIANTTNILVYDVANGNFQQVTSLALASNQDATTLAVYDNEVYVFITNKGLVKYRMDFDGANYSLNELATITLPNNSPDFMAADFFGLYLGYRLKGLFAYNRQTLAQTGYYRTGLSYREYTQQYGIQDLFCKDGLIVLVEYHSQTSLLTNDNNFTRVKQIISPPDDCSIIVHPNPFSDHCTIEYPYGKSLYIYDMPGNMIGPGAKKEIIDNLTPGIYILEAEGCRPEKLVKIE